MILNQDVREDLRNKIPYYKKLINSKENYGLPIGILTFQLFANIYLDCLDKYVKHTLKIRYYIRYYYNQ